MRFLDIAVSILIGTSAITGMVVLGPGVPDRSSRALASRTQLRDTLLALIEDQGVAWLLRSSPAQVCSYLSGASNASVVVSANIGSYSCGAPPEGGVQANLTLPLVPREVTLEAWSTVGA